MNPVLEVGKTYNARRGKERFKILTVGGTHIPWYTVEEVGSKKRFDQYEPALLKKVQLEEVKSNLVRLSATQGSTFDRCKRKWAFRYIDKLAQPMKPELTFGTDIHDTIETYLTTGKPLPATDLGATVQQGIKKEALPEPGSEMLVEHEFHIPILNGAAEFMGYIDLVIPGDPLIVEDHKSTKDLRYAMTSDDLEADWQANLYGKWGLLTYEVDHVVCKWNYFAARPSKGSPDGRPRTPRGFRQVVRVKPRAEIEKHYQRFLESAQQMVELKQTDGIRANDVDANTEACGDYGGCPWFDACDIPKGQVFSNLKLSHSKRSQERPEDMSSLIDVIRGTKTEAKGVNPPPVEKSEPSAHSAPAPESETAREAKTVSDAVSEDTTPSETAPEPKKRGRPKKKAGFMVLAVDCLPAKGSPFLGGNVDLTEILRPFKDQIQTEAKLPHWNLLDYRKGEQMLAALLEKNLNENRHEAVIVCDSRSDEWKACGSILTERADIVIRGV